MYKPPKKKMLGQEAIPTTSLADMMFLLLIFFIMTSTLARVTGFVSDMPSGATGKQEQAQKTPVVLLQDDKIIVEDREVNMAQLEGYLGKLQLAKKTGEGKVVMLSTAGNVNYQNYYEAMALISANGGVIAIESQETETKP